MSRHSLGCRRLRIFGESFQSSKIDRFLVQQNRLIEYRMLYFPSSDAIIFHVSRTMSIDHEIYQVSSRFGIKVEASIERYFDGWSVSIERETVICAPFGTLNELPPASRFILDPKITIQGRKKRRAWYRYVTIAGRIRDCDNIQIVDSSNVVAISFLQSIRLIVIPKRIVSWNATQR